MDPVRCRKTGRFSGIWRLDTPVLLTHAVRRLVGVSDTKRFGLVAPRLLRPVRRLHGEHARYAWPIIIRPIIHEALAGDDRRGYGGL